MVIHSVKHSITVQLRQGSGIKSVVPHRRPRVQCVRDAADRQRPVRLPALGDHLDRAATRLNVLDAHSRGHLFVNVHCAAVSVLALQFTPRQGDGGVPGA